HSETSRTSWRGAVATSVLLGLGCLGSTAALSQQTSPAGDAQVRTYHIGAQSLDTALQEFAAQAGLQLLFSKSDVAGLTTQGLEGSFSADQVLRRLLAGSGLIFEYPKAGAVIIRRPGNSTESSPSTSASDAPGTRNPAAAPSSAAAAATAAASNLTPAGNGSTSVTNIDE